LIVNAISKISFSALVALCVMPVSVALAECVDDTDSMSTLRQMVDQVPEEQRRQGWFEISERTCVSIKWTGDVRENPANVDAFLDVWSQVRGVPATSRAMYKKQILVREGDQEFWLPIQEQLLPYLHDEVMHDGDVTLQLKRYGARPNEDVVFGVQEFLAGATELKQSPDEIARDALQTLIQEHPSASVREDLDRWIVDHDILLSFTTRESVAEIAVALVEFEAQLQPVMIMNSDWMVDTRYSDPERDRRYKELVVFHEYWHLKDHFDGVVELPRLQLNIDDARARIEELARRMWTAESRASYEEWKLATRLGVTDLMSWAPQPGDDENSEAAFLDAFYDRIMESDRHALDPRLKDAMHAEWKKIHER